MGLREAIDAHSKGDLNKAEHFYKLLLKQSNTSPTLFQNYGALLRATDRFELAEKIYLQGLELHKDHPSINLNIANLYRDALGKPTTAIKHYFNVFLHCASRGDLVDSSEAFSALHSGVVILRELECYAWAYHLIKSGLSIQSSHPGLLVNLILLLDQELSYLSVESNTSLSVEIKELILKQVHLIPPKQQIDVFFGLANHEISQSNASRAHDYYEKALAASNSIDQSDPEALEKVRNNMLVNGWNMGCLLLKLQDFKAGWKLFEHGLLTPAPGPQRWQRSLAKPFSDEEITLWRGESLKGKSILLLEEQAIGDAMMFLSLISSLAQEAQNIGILLCDRLVPIYRRTMSACKSLAHCTVYSHSDYAKGILQSRLFDVQSPIGSMCQYRFSKIHQYSPQSPCISAREEIASKLRQSYLNGASSETKLIGISWRGGGKPDRIKKKSVEEDLFFKLISGISNVRFVSLQYGQCKETLSGWASQGLPVIYDQRINSLKNMEAWVDQVSACDAVLSVANTTIHGAGGLGIPTMCLLSRAADWRWFSDESVTRSYWYPSVGIARETSESGWDDAFNITRQWLLDGCPYPQGSVSTLP